MKLTITTLDGQILPIEVNEDLELENLKAQCEFELGIPASNIVLTWNGRPLHNDKMTLRGYGIPDGDILLLQQMSQPQMPSNPQPTSSASGGGAGGGIPALDFSSIAIPGQAQPVRPELEDPKVILELIKNNPRERALIKERNPALSDALESGNVERFVQVYTKQRQERLRMESERNRLISLDPFDPEAQKLIAEEIRLKNVESNMESAIEHVPESFGQVVMLYVDCKVNGHPVKAFVDSGAQMTIMSQKCAERCEIMRLVDRRWAGIAKGVGTQTIIGRVHLGCIQIGNDYLQSSFSILQDQTMDMLLGLDMLKRHQCIIDMKNNELVIGTTGHRTNFLPENQLPNFARIHGNQSESDDGELARALQESANDASGSSSSGMAPPGSSVQLPSASLGPPQPSSSSSSSSSPQGALPRLSSSIQPHEEPPTSIASPQTTPTPQAAAGQPTNTNSFPESVINRLVGQGYSRSDVIGALTEAAGNEQSASMILFAKFFKM